MVPVLRQLLARLVKSLPQIPLLPVEGLHIHLLQRHGNLAAAAPAVVSSVGVEDLYLAGNEERIPAATATPKQSNPFPHWDTPVMKVVETDIPGRSGLHC